MGLEPRFSIDAFFKDVLNKITTFASPEDAQIGAKSLQSPLQRVVNQFQTTVISHTDFWSSQMPPQVGLGGPRHGADPTPAPPVRAWLFLIWQGPIHIENSDSDAEVPQKYAKTMIMIERSPTNVKTLHFAW